MCKFKLLMVKFIIRQQITRQEKLDNICFILFLGQTTIAKTIINSQDFKPQKLLKTLIAQNAMFTNLKFLHMV